MTEPNLLELAKKGDAESIASLMNRQLQPKGITAKAELKNNCLHVMLECPPQSDRKVLAEWVRKSLISLSAASIQRVKIYGAQTGEELPDWHEEFDLAPPHSTPETAAKKPSLKTLAKQGDVEALTKLLNRTLLSKNITVKASLKNGCLQIMLESQAVPDEPSATTLIHRELASLKIESLKTVKLYGRKTGEEFPAWNKEFEIAAETPLPPPPATPSSISTPVILPKSKPAPPSITGETIILAGLAVMGALWLLNQYGMVGVFLTGVLALIPAKIAADKGRNIINWYCYGFLLFFIALIHAVIIEDEKGDDRLNFINQNLRDRNFTGCDLMGANFQNADIRGANFSHAQILGANFSYAKGEDANFSNAYVAGAYFNNAILENANFSEVQVSLQEKWALLIAKSVPWWVWVIFSPLILFFATYRYLSGSFFGAIAVVVGVTYAAIALGRKKRERIVEIIGILGVVIVISILKIWAYLSGGAVLILAAGAIAIANAISAAKAKHWTLFGTCLGALMGLGWLSVTTALDMVRYPHAIAYAFAFHPVRLILFNLAYSLFGALAGRLTGASFAVQITSFQGANLTKANFTASKLQNADFTKANLRDVNWTDADLTGAIIPAGAK